MPEPNLFKIFISRLNKLGMPYMVTGAVAIVIYGEPRLTHDIDLVVDLNREDAEKIAAYIYEGDLENPVGFAEHYEQQHGKKLNP